MTHAPNDQDPWTQVADWVFRIAGEIRYGKVEITVHDARIVQLEVTEKFRSPPPGRPSPEPRRRKEGEVAEHSTG